MLLFGAEKMSRPIVDPNGSVCDLAINRAAGEWVLRNIVVRAFLYLELAVKKKEHGEVKIVSSVRGRIKRWSVFSRGIPIGPARGPTGAAIARLG